MNPTQTEYYNRCCEAATAARKAINELEAILDKAAPLEDYWADAASDMRNLFASLNDVELQIRQGKQHLED